MEFSLSSESIDDVIKLRSVQSPLNNALSYGSDSCNYRELEIITGKTAGRLLKAGFGGHSRVALMADTKPESVTLLYSLLRVGATAVLLGPSAGKEEFEYAQSIADFTDLIISSDSVKNVPENIKVWSADGKYGNILPDAEYTEQVKETCSRSDVRKSGLVIFTSGTTSHPKAVFLDQYRLINNARCHRNFFKVSEEDRIAAALPMEHILCVIITMLMPLVSGACMCITNDIHTSSILETIENQKCTFLCGVPTMYHAIIKRPDFFEHDVSSLRTGMTGGAACSKELFAEIETKLGIRLISTLGQTETSGGFTMYREDETDIERYTSVGVPSWGMEVKISGGEICVKGYLVSGGYLKKPEETAELIDAEGWLHTGDMGFFDENGLLYVNGRKKDIIIRGGENISSLQIEEMLEKCQGVRDVKCFGVPDEHHGEEICVCVVPEEGEMLTEEAVRAFAADNIESRKVPRYIKIMEDFPRTDVGKICTAKLKGSVLNELGIRM